MKRNAKNAAQAKRDVSSKLSDDKSSCSTNGLNVADSLAYCKISKRSDWLVISAQA